jgi:hypothetical protein
MDHAAYLVHKPTGAPLVMLIVALVLFAVAMVVATAVPIRTAPPRDLWGLFVAAGLGFLVLALLVS